ncbi:MAG TPA: VTT domain-containing protein [Magnetospirillaceae bacterium]|nr:VTT domain-containing protein [Magnetospirillaceae bacterium]
MLFGMNLTEVIQAIGVLGIAAMVFAESGMMVGFFLPGDTLLFTAGFLTQQGVLNVNIHLFVIVLFVAAVVGDQIGYFIGHKVGRKLFRKPESLLFHQSNLERAEKFYEKYGPITIILARFVPVVRTFAPVVAGIGSMSYKTFLLFDVIGGALWVGTIAYMGYYGGAFLEEHGINVEMLVMPVILLAIAASVGSPLWHILRDGKRRGALWARLKVKG